MSYSIEDPPADAPKAAPKTKGTTFSARDPMLHAIILAIVAISMIGWAVYNATTDKSGGDSKPSSVQLKQPKLGGKGDE